MLTVGAHEHPLMKRMHKPGEEKRMVVILDRNDYVPWLSCSVVDAPLYFKPWLGSLLGEPAPLARAPKAATEPPTKDKILPPKPAKPAKSAKPSTPTAPPPPQGDLF